MNICMNANSAQNSLEQENEAARLSWMKRRGAEGSQQGDPEALQAGDEGKARLCSHQPSLNAPDSSASGLQSRRAQHKELPYISSGCCTGASNRRHRAFCACKRGGNDRQLCPVRSAKQAEHQLGRSHGPRKHRAVSNKVRVASHARSLNLPPSWLQAMNKKRLVQQICVFVGLAADSPASF